MDRRKQMLKNLSRVLNPTMGVVKGTIDALNAPTTRKYSVGGGMMNKPMGYKSGTMVKARGCKLGRNKTYKNVLRRDNVPKKFTWPWSEITAR
jgi:hypothetical protein